MGLCFLVYLDEKIIYKCQCETHLTHVDFLNSKKYQAETGRAYLFTKVFNIFTGICEDRQMSSGLHTVCDIFCSFCYAKLGWKYERAYDEKNKFKEGKFILERKLISKFSE